MQVFLIIVIVLAALFLLLLTPPAKRLRQFMMAVLYTRVQRDYDDWIAARKRALFADFTGTVLEIGPGTGVNFEHLPPAVTHWIGIEPNPFMHAELRETARKHALEAEFREVSTEGMEVPAESVDVVLSTLVLCSVQDPVTVVQDIMRILKPGGRLVFIEHVGAPRGSGLRRLQGCVRPLWKIFADGCCTDRDTADVLRQAGFAQLELEEFRVPSPPMPRFVSPHIAGVATKAPQGL